MLTTAPSSSRRADSAYLSMFFSFTAAPHRSPRWLLFLLPLPRRCPQPLAPLITLSPSSQGYHRLRRQFPQLLECTEKAFVRAVAELKASAPDPGPRPQPLRAR